MASNKEYVDFIFDLIENAGEIVCKNMFGEYGIYSNGKFFGMICDNRFLIKPTKGGKAFMGHFEEAAAYPGAKPSLLIDERMEDREWLSELIRISVKELPEPKPKKKKTKK